MIISKMGLNLSPEKILTDLGVTSPEHIDLEAIAFSLGAVVKYRLLDGCAARIIGCNDRAIISVDPRCNEGRKRFSVGHEIGHWINDRGKGAHLCSQSLISESSSVGNISEKKANEFSSDLILPEFLLKPRLVKRDVNFKAVKEIKDEFKTSITATAIKCVLLSENPAMLVSFKTTGERWFKRGNNLSPNIFPVQELDVDSVAFNILYGAEGKEAGPVTVRADRWISHRGAREHYIQEHSLKITSDTVLSLLWWKANGRILNFQ
jgi:hypothetical protein